MRPTRWKPENSQTPGNWRLHFSMCCSKQTRGVEVCQLSCLEMYNLYLPDNQAPSLITTNQICGVSSGVSLANKTEQLETWNDAYRLPCHRAPTPLPFKSTVDEGSFLQDDGFRRLGKGRPDTRDRRKASVCAEFFSISQVPDDVFPPFISGVTWGDLA